MICPNCGFDSPREMHFCGICGTRLTIDCPSCNFANPLHYKFCGMCGVWLAQGGLEAVLPPHQHMAETEAGFVSVVPLHPIEGERRDVTVVVTDLTDSTSLLENVGTEGWVELMNHILHILESEINRFGGEISQFRGDGLVAFFGVTMAHEDDPERAVLAALSMQRAFDLYVRELSNPEANQLKMRLGIDTGEVIVTTGTHRQQWEETAMGLAVTIASRMETSAEPGTVLVSEHTYRLTQTKFEWLALGEISVKGVSQAIPVYRPLQHKEDGKILPDEPWFPESFPHLGRDTQFHTLKKSLEGLLEGRGHITTLTGEVGSGKSFLLNRLEQYFAHLGTLLEESRSIMVETVPSLRWVRGRCRSYNQTWPYSMWADLFNNWLEIRPDASKLEKRDSLRHYAELVWGDDLEEYYPYLANFLGLPVEDVFKDKLQHLDGEELRQRYFITVKSWIENWSQNEPVVLAFSDMHWVDDSSLALLKYCLPVCDGEAVLWLLSFRSDHDTSIWEFYLSLEINYPHRLTRVELPPLSEPQSVELINQLIGPETLSQEIRQLIIHNSEGNPYYIIELVRALVTKGILLRESDGTWRVTRTVTKLDLPENLQRLLLARIDRLASHERLVLQIASVVGLMFWSNMLQELLGDIPTLKADLAALQRNQFIQENGRVSELGMQYNFKSPMIRDTTYESLLSSQRIIYHKKVAEYLENLMEPDTVEGLDGMLAYHYGGAGDSKKELFYTVLAAERARAVYGNVEALQYYNRALELLDRLKAELEGKNRPIQTQRFEVLTGRRAILLDLGEIEGARADTHALLQLAQQMPDDRTWLIDALLAHAEFPATTRDELRPSLQVAEHALDLSRELGDKPRELSSLMSVARIRLTLKESDSLSIAEEALALARQLGDLSSEVSILLRIGNAYGVDNLSRSREYLEAALAKSESLNDKRVEIPLLETLGRQFERDGDYHRQLTQYEHRRLKLGREIGNRYVEGQALMFCGQIEALYLGDYESGLSMEREALRIWEAITGRVFPLLRIAQILAVQGQYEAALSTLETARPLADKVVMEIGRAGLGMVNIILFNALGDEAHLWQALELVAQIQRMTSDNLVSQQYRMAASCEASDTHLKLATLFRERDQDEYRRQIEQALESSQTALDLYHNFGFVQIVECTSEEILYRHSLALAANDRPSEASEFLERAYREMMRKYELIPEDSAFRKTYLENIQLHRDILTANKAKTGRMKRNTKSVKTE